MPVSSLKSSAGFTYIAALMLIVIMGIMLGIVGQSWKMTSDREKEAELLARGDEIRTAMIRWYRPHGNRIPGMVAAASALQDLDHLCKDPRLTQNVKYLRCQYIDGRLRVKPDPITGKEWRLIKDPNMGIIGVASSSEKQPIKKANFPPDYIDFEDKKKYSEWEFVWNRQPAPRQTKTKIKGIQTSDSPTSPVTQPVPPPVPTP